MFLRIKIQALFWSGIFIALGVPGRPATASSSPAWSLTSHLTQEEGGRITRHKLTFTSGSEQVIYVPAQPPFGVVSEERVRLNGKYYFLTGWAHGGATMMFRVFEPEGHQAQPLCQKVSLSEESQLRVKNSRLEILITVEGQQKPGWVECKNLK